MKIAYLFSVYVLASHTGRNIYTVAAGLSLEYNLLFIFTLSDLLCFNIRSLVWTEHENSEQSPLRLWRRRQPSSPRSVTAGQAEEVGQLLIETGSRWPIADGPRASQCGY